MSEGSCRYRVAARVISTLSQVIQACTASGAVGVFTTTVIDAVDTEVPPPPGRDHQ